MYIIIYTQRFVSSSGLFEAQNELIQSLVARIRGHKTQQKHHLVSSPCGIWLLCLYGTSDAFILNRDVL